jgi:outer membrane lipoprotein-sorting protein
LAYRYTAICNNIPLLDKGGDLTLMMMKLLLVALVFATVAVAGNALDALTMKQSSAQKSSYSGSNAQKYRSASGSGY